MHKETELKFNKILLPHLRMMPFDWKTPFGYFMAWMAQLTGNFAIILAVMSLLSLLFASCLLFTTIMNDISRELAAFNIDVEILHGTKRNAKLVRRFCNNIQLYSEAKQ